jgi:hypothetical protein
VPGIRVLQQVRALLRRLFPKHAFPALASIALLPVAACHKAADPGSALVVQSEISPLPARIGSETIMLALFDLSAKPVSGASIVLEADMSHAGMAPVFGESTEVEPGHYRGNLAFSMAGDWVVLLHVTLANGTRVERQIQVKGVGAN